jgi:malate permease and related proteins
MNMFMMGAYASMTMQLFLFGIYLYEANILELNKKLLLWVLSLKFILLPLIAFIVLININMASTIKGIIFIELLMPLAVANVNIASLYDCKPKVTTTLVFVSSVVFLGVIFIGVKSLIFL